MTLNLPAMLLVGIVRRPHGLAGEVSVDVATDFPQRFTPGVRFHWSRDSDERSLDLVSARPHGGRMLLTFEGVSTAEAARELAGGELSVPESEAFPVPPGYFYSHELSGFSCVDGSGRALGTVRDLARTPAGPLLSIETTAAKEALVPFVEEMVKEIDLRSRRIVLELPEGLLDL